MTKNNSKRYIIGIAVALLLPLSVFYITRKLATGVVHLPKYYISDKIDSQVVNGKMKYDTTFHKVADLRLTNQLGQEISLNKDLAGKILVVDFIFTNCSGPCPKLTRNMAMLQKAFKKKLDTAVQLITITVDPARDSFPVLRKYAERYNVNHDYWWFLTGEKAAIYNYARNELYLSVQPGDGGVEDFVHTEKFVLLDQYRYIRGYYDGKEGAEMKRCSDDVVLLFYENKKRK